MTGYSSARALEWPHNGAEGSISEVAAADAGSCGKIVGSLKSLPWTRILVTWEPARSVRCDGVRKCIICRLICALISLEVPRAPQRGCYDSTTDGRLEGCPKGADWWSPNPPRTCSDLRCSWKDGISGLNSQRPQLSRSGLEFPNLRSSKSPAGDTTGVGRLSFKRKAGRPSDSTLSWSCILR